MQKKEFMVIFCLFAGEGLPSLWIPGQEKEAAAGQKHLPGTGRVVASEWT
jgi:hypothetical protein